MSELKPYEEYKDSGIGWITKIPSHWEEIKMKYLLKKIQTGSTPPSMQHKYYNGNINWFTPADFTHSKKLISSNRKIDDSAIYDNVVSFFPERSILLVGIGATLGKVAMLSESSTFNQQITGLITYDELFDSDLLYYWLKINKEVINDTANYTTLPIINNEYIKNFTVIIPPAKEQKKIVRFLDNKLSEIDSLIEDKECLIELLEEKRQAIITETVTQGLDPNVKMKDSGIEWIGEIPEHWKIAPIKWLTSVRRGASPRPIDDPKYFDENGEYSWVRIADVSRSGMYLFDTSQKLSVLGSDLSVKLQPNELFISIAGTVGKPCITKINCCIHDGFIYLPEFKNSKKYLYYIFKSERPYQGLGKMGTQLNLNTETIGSIRIPLPSLEEQHEIALEIEVQENKYDGLINEIQTQISKLREYSESLIYEAVTGKIDLRDY